MKRFWKACGLLLGAAALAVLLYHVIPVRILTEHEREQVASIEVVCWGVEERLTLTDPEEIDRILAPFLENRFRRGKPLGGNLAMQFLLYNERGTCLAVLQETAAGGTLQLKRGIRFYHPVREDPAFEALYRSFRERMEAGIDP